MSALYIKIGIYIIFFLIPLVFIGVSMEVPVNTEKDLKQRSAFLILLSSIIVLGLILLKIIDYEQ